MKRLFWSLSLVLLALLTPSAAYAQGQLCPPAFANLCKIRAEKGGGVFGPAIIYFMIVAVVACLVFLVIGGIKWITSGGDQQKIAQARQTLIAALVGLVIALCTFFIVGTVLGVFGIGLSSMKLPKLVP